MKRILLAAVSAAVILVSPAAAAAPTFAVGASAIVLPKSPSFAPKPRNFRAVYRVGRGIYCVAPSPAFDWTRHAPLVAALPDQSKQRPGTVLAAWEARGQRCPAAAVQVRTLRLAAGELKAANDVAFHILIGGAD